VGFGDCNPLAHGDGNMKPAAGSPRTAPAREDPPGLPKVSEELFSSKVVRG